MFIPQRGTVGPESRGYGEMSPITPVSPARPWLKDEVTEKCLFLYYFSYIKIMHQKHQDDVEWPNFKVYCMCGSSGFYPAVENYDAVCN